MGLSRYLGNGSKQDQLGQNGHCAPAVLFYNPMTPCRIDYHKPLTSRQCTDIVAVHSPEVPEASGSDTTRNGDGEGAAGYLITVPTSWAGRTKRMRCGASARRTVGAVHGSEFGFVGAVIRFPYSKNPRRGGDLLTSGSA